MKVSAQDLNRIEAPSQILTVYTSKGIDVKIDRSEAYLKVPAGFTGEIEFYLVTDEETYTLMLVPLPIPAQTITIKGKGGKPMAAAEKGLPYIEEIKRLLRATVRGDVPAGFEGKEIKEKNDLCPYVECALIPIQELAGQKFKGMVYLLTNTTSETRNYSEEVFSGKGIRAVAIERHRLGPGEVTRLFRVEEVLP